MEMSKPTNGNVENDKSYTEITTEITTKGNTPENTTSSVAGATVAKQTRANAKKQKQATAAEHTDTHRLRLHFEGAWKKRYRRDYYWQGQDGNHAKKLLTAAGGLEPAKKVVDRYLASEDKFFTDAAHPFRLIMPRINSLLGEPPDPCEEFWSDTITDEDRRGMEEVEATIAAQNERMAKRIAELKEQHRRRYGKGGEAA